MRGYIPYKDYKALHFPGYLTITFVRHAAPHRSLKLVFRSVLCDCLSLNVPILSEANTTIICEIRLRSQPPP